MSSVPLLRDIVALGTMTLCMTSAIGMSLTVIALAWIRYRPWLGLTVLTLALLPFVVAKYRTAHRQRGRFD